MKIISERYIEEIVSYEREFEYKSSKFIGSGFSFPSDEYGNVDVTKLTDSGLKSYNDCILGKITVTRGQQWIYNADNDYVPVPGTGSRTVEDIVDLGVRKSIHSYTHAAVCQCDCGNEIQLSHFTNTCEVCERDYNMSGQLLSDRSTWGSETGEHLSDILRIP